MEAWRATAPTKRVPVVEYYAEKVYSPSPKGYGWYVVGGPGSMLPGRSSFPEPSAYWDGGYYETLSEAKAACVAHLGGQLFDTKT